jgi:hypothetical protein
MKIFIKFMTGNYEDVQEQQCKVSHEGDIVDSCTLHHVELVFSHSQLVLDLVELDPRDVPVLLELVFCVLSQVVT